MKTVAAALIAAAVLAQGSEIPRDLTGVWAVTVDSPNGSIGFGMSIPYDDAALTLLAGSWYGPGAPETRAGTVAVAGSELTIKFELDDRGGPVQVTMTGTVQGDTMKGTADFGGLATAPWTATRTALAPYRSADGVAGVPLSGSVRDIYTRDGFLAGATITLTQHETGLSGTWKTGAEGKFNVPSVPPGGYTVKVAMPGYQGLVVSTFCILPNVPARFNAALGPQRGGAPSRDGSHTFVTLPPSIPSAGTMTTSEIDEAVAFGKGSDRMTPIALTQSRGLIRYRAGHLYMPFLRLAMMSKVAAAAQKPFTAAHIPARFAERLAWIAGLPEEHSVWRSDGDSTLYAAAVSRIVIRPKGAKDAGRDIRPAWSMLLTTECDTDIVQRFLGAQFPRPGLLAAFPVDAIGEGSTVVFTYSEFASQVHGTGAIRVKPAERRVTLTAEHLRHASRPTR